MAFLVVLPGTVLPPRPLVEVLREEHEARAADHALRTAWRKEQGIPSTPDIDWQEEKRRLLALVSIVEGPDPDGALVALGHQAGIVAMQPAPRDPGPWVQPDGLDGVTVEPRALKASVRNTLRDAWRAAVSAGVESRPAADELIIACIATVGGLDFAGHDEPGSVDLSPTTLETLWECGLGPYLLAASLHLTSLDPKKVLRSGVRPLPT